LVFLFLVVCSIDLGLSKHTETKKTIKILVHILKISLGLKFQQLSIILQFLFLESLGIFCLSAHQQEELRVCKFTSQSNLSLNFPRVAFESLKSGIKTSVKHRLTDNKLNSKSAPTDGHFISVTNVGFRVALCVLNLFRKLHFHLEMLHSGKPRLMEKHIFHSHQKL
jgi:hypothetical protein